MDISVEINFLEQNKFFSRIRKIALTSAMAHDSLQTSTTSSSSSVYRVNGANSVGHVARPTVDDLRVSWWLMLRIEDVFIDEFDYGETGQAVLHLQRGRSVRWSVEIRVFFHLASFIHVNGM